MKPNIFFTLLKALLIILFLSSCKYTEKKIPWINLIANEGLDGWNIKGGEATYKNENSTIIGTTAANTPNTFLCSNKEYEDFI